MGRTTESLTYDRDKSAILFQGKTVISLAEVGSGTPARIYSSLMTDRDGMETRFFITGSKKPFQIDHSSLSVNGFLRAVVENRFELEGMRVSETLMEVYSQVFDS